MEIKKTTEGKQYQYQLLNNNQEVARIKGMLFNEQIVISLYEFSTTNKLHEKEYAQKLGKPFIEDCRKNDSTIIVTQSEKTKQAIWFLEHNQFTRKFTHYVFENDLTQLNKPQFSFDLKPFHEIDLASYQKIYFECSKGDPEVDLTGHTPQSHYERDQKEIGDLWNEALMHLVYFENTPIGVLNLRTEEHPKNNILEGSINYLGLIPTYRKRGLGKALHLTGLHQLKALGCQNYFGGTEANNRAMLRTFAANRCFETLVQYYYRV